MPAEKIECNRWSDAELNERCLQKFEVWHVPASSTRCLSRLMLSDYPLQSIQSILYLLVENVG